MRIPPGVWRFGQSAGRGRPPPCEHLGKIGVVQIDRDLDAHLAGAIWVVFLP